jgi:iron complex outermembrane receptor protein
MVQAGLRFDNRQITSIENGTPGEEGYFKAVDRSFDSFNASLGYKTNLAQSTMRLNGPLDLERLTCQCF